MNWRLMSPGGRFLLFLKGPKTPALFSERNGYHRVFRLFGGWRFVLKDLRSDYRPNYPLPR